MKGPTVSPWNAVSPEEMAASFDGCLDIETPGLSCEYSGITVIGIYLVNGADDSLVQLVGMDVTAGNLLESLAGVNRVYTYNGSVITLSAGRIRFSCIAASIRTPLRSCLAGDRLFASDLFVANMARCLASFLPI